MKKLLLASLILCGIVSASTAKSGIGIISSSIPADFVKSKTQTWPGEFQGKTYWYKIDAQAKLWWSTDGKKWAAVESGSWTDKDGKWLKINEGKLVWSTDGAKWEEVPDWKWMGSDGSWYKFDDKWVLWVNK